MAIDNLKLFTSNPFGGGGVGPGQIGKGVQPPESKGTESGPQKGNLFSNFSLPESHGPKNSFLREGALGEDAIYGQKNARLGGQFNALA